MVELIEVAADTVFSFHHGEIFIENTYVNRISLSDQKIRNNIETREEGFSIRSVVDKTTNFFASNNLSKEGILYMCKNFNTKKTAPLNGFVTKNLYPDTIEYDFNLGILMKEIDAYVRNKISVINVSIFSQRKLQQVWIYNSHGHMIQDFRPMVGLSVESVFYSKNKQQKSHYMTLQKRHHASILFNNWQEEVDKYICEMNDIINAEQVVLNNKLPVILGPGSPAVLLHEAIGHSLEGDSIANNASNFCNKLNKKVSHETVQIYDNGTIPNMSGSLNFDDEGFPTINNQLVKNGILINYMCDGISREKLGLNDSFSAKRQNYKCIPIPRMMNTYIANGQHSEESLINQVKDGYYVKKVSHGSVEHVSGQFSFIAPLVCLIKN